MAYIFIAAPRSKDVLRVRNAQIFYFHFSSQRSFFFVVDVVVLLRFILVNTY